MMFEILNAVRDSATLKIPYNFIHFKGQRKESISHQLGQQYGTYQR